MTGYRSRVRRTSSWFRRIKTRAGYYEVRRKLYRGTFRRSLRPTDTFLVGHPKSGNTWLAYMLAILLSGDHEGRVTLKNVGEFVPFVHGRDYRIRRYGSLPSPRIFRNEYPEYGDLYPKVIYLVRDPRAAIVSLWQMYHVMSGDADLSLESFVTQYMAGDGIFSWWNSKLLRWDLQVQEYVDRAASDPGIVLIKYEDLVADRRLCLENLIDFLRIRPGASELDLAVARGSFEAMRLDEDTHGTEAYDGRATGEGRFIRIGKAEGWRDEMALDQAARIEEAFAPVMNLAGYA